MNKEELFFQTYLNLEKDVMELAKYVFFTDNQLDVYSPYIADLLVRCAVEIEGISKELYFHLNLNMGEREVEEKTIYFDSHCLAELDKKWTTSKKRVLITSPLFYFKKKENQILRPLKEAHKQGKNFWKKAYQSVKHDRYNNLEHGNIRNLLGALASLFLLNVYYKRPSWTCNYSDLKKMDYSMGSRIFSLKSPNIDKLWEGQPSMDVESPFIVHYTNADFAKIKAIKEREAEDIKAFLFQQEEIMDEEFANHLQKIFKEKGESWKNLNVIIQEWGEYRLNKKIPSDLSFEQRRELFIASEEWKGRIYQNNTPLQKGDLTQENIQGEINRAGRLWGIDRTRYMHQSSRWIRAVMDGLCTVSIPNEG